MALPDCNAAHWITQLEQEHLVQLLESTPDLTDTLSALLARLKGNNGQNTVLACQTGILCIQIVLLHTE